MQLSVANAAATGIITVLELVNFFKKKKTKEMLSDLHKVKTNLKNVPVFLWNFSPQSVTVFPKVCNIKCKGSIPKEQIIDCYSKLLTNMNIIKTSRMAIAICVDY